MKAFLPLAGFFLQLYGCQRLLRAEQGRQAALALALMQAGWMLAGWLMDARAARVGALNFLAQAPFLILPLALVLRRGLGRRWLILAGLLAFSGCIPFISFSAYLQTFTPMMSVGDGVADMRMKLYSAAGLLAVVATLCVVYQTSALGYFYWSRVLPGGAQAPKAGWKEAWLWLGLALSAWLGLHAVAWTTKLAALHDSLGL